MGFFGSRKKKALPSVADVFSTEDLQRIGEVIGPKRDSKSYKMRYRDLADHIMWVVEAPEKSYTKREWNGIIYAAGAMTKLEPELAPMLKAAIERFHAFRKK